MGERRADPAGPSPQLPGRRDAAGRGGREEASAPRAPSRAALARARPAPARSDSARAAPASRARGLGRGPCHFPGGPSDMPLAGGRLPAAATRGAVLPAAEARRGAGPATRVIVLRASPPCGWSCVWGVRPQRTVSSCSDQSEVSAGGRWPARLGRPDRAPAAGGPWPGLRGTLAERPGGPGAGERGLRRAGSVLAAALLLSLAGQSRGSRGASVP